MCSGPSVAVFCGRSIGCFFLHCFWILFSPLVTFRVGPSRYCFVRSFHIPHLHDICTKNSVF
jgi:hypothetical protein